METSAKAAVILGSGSEIGGYLRGALEADGWEVVPWKRGEPVPRVEWNLVLCCIGQVAPVGIWHDIGNVAWNSAIDSNLELPLFLLRLLWSQRNPDAAVCFLAGSNPNRVMPGYSAYNAGKMALLKAVESIDAETPDAKIFALGPGYHPTKIHRASEGWPNDVIARGPKVTMQQVYDCLKWCLAQPKSVIGGRNICASDPMSNELAARLALNPSLYKLRRVE